MQLKMDKSDVLTNECYSEVARIVGQQLDLMTGQDVIDAITGVMDDEDDVQSCGSEDDSGSEALPQLVLSAPVDDDCQPIPKRDILGAPRHTEEAQEAPDLVDVPIRGSDSEEDKGQDDTIQFLEVEFI